VLCRELAICRETNAKKLLEDAKAEPQQVMNDDMEMTDDPTATALLPDAAERDAPKPENNTDEDVTMEDAKPATGDDSTSKDTSSLEQATNKDDAKSSSLNVDTNIESKPTDEPAPMTANTDLDSLFQDADDDVDRKDTQDGNNGTDRSNAAANDNPFNFDTSDTNAKENPTADPNPDNDNDQSTFRSGAKGGDNDNLSSLLPGLQDYAAGGNGDGDLDFGGSNNESAEAGGMSNTEFDALFGSSDAFATNNDSSSNNNNNSNNHSNNEDPFGNTGNAATGGDADGETFNFEAFMNSTDFDTEGAAAAAAAGGNGQGGANGGGNTGMGDGMEMDQDDGQQFDFDSIFQ
jgi:hypothetical protein